jgi:hypothetical protein
VYCALADQQRGWTVRLWFINWNRFPVVQFLLLPSNHRQLLRRLVVAAPKLFLSLIKKNIDKM